jgi:hypothetical protein
VSGTGRCQGAWARHGCQVSGLVSKAGSKGKMGGRGRARELGASIRRVVSDVQYQRRGASGVVSDARVSETRVSDVQCQWRGVRDGVSNMRVGGLEIGRAHHRGVCVPPSV